MRINHNIAALNTYNKLSANTAATSKALEKLSSGLKINRAGDNAAGLAISEKMRGQISGLDTASSNASDGISLIQTAEGALNETHSILQRMRELAVQSSNDTNTDADRNEIQKEIDTLTQEVDRISTDTEFNTQKLLNGDKATKVNTGAYTGLDKTTVEGSIQSGSYTATVTVKNATGTQATDFTQTKTLSDPESAVSDFTTDNTGGQFTGVVSMDAAAGAAGTNALEVDDTASQKLTDDLNLGAGTYTIRGTISGANTTYTLEDSGGNVLYTAAPVANATAAITFGTSNISLTHVGSANDTTTFAVTGQYSMDGGTTKINSGSADTSGTGLTVNLATGAKAGDKFSMHVGAATAPTVDLTGTDVKKGTYQLVVSKYNNTAHTATLTLQDDKGNTVKDANGKDYQKDVTGLGTGTTPFAGISITNTSITGDSTSKFTITEAKVSSVSLKDAAGQETEGLKFKLNEKAVNNDTFAVTVDASNEMKFQIGANEKQSTSLSINEMGAKALGIDKLDLTTQAGADAAITTIDSAISSVSSERAKLGAVQNRLEHTINNLGTSSENLSSAESRIRDVDMAKEMMEFTKNNILSQAAQSMLAQANQQPQGVLQLLQ